MYRNTFESREQLLATVNMKVKQNFRENGLRENEKEKEKKKERKFKPLPFVLNWF